MKTKARYVWITIVVILMIAGVYAYREYNRKPSDLSYMAPRLRTTADSLVALFENDEPKADSIYLGKPVDVMGIIAEITNQKDTVVNVVLGKKDDMHRVSCLMNIQHIDNIKAFNAGDEITLRGICNGYLMDVELNRCVVIK